MKANKKKYFLTTALLVFISIANQLFGQIVIEEEPKLLYYDITAKRITNFWEMKNMRDVFHKDKYLMGKNRITGNIAYNTGRVLINDGINNQKQYRSALSFFTRIRFFEEFSFNTNFYIDFNKKANARWISDYTYSIGRYTWRPNKFNYGYENYINNKYSDDFRTFAENFLQGYYFVSYNRLLSQKLLEAIRLDNSTNVKFIGFVRYSIKYKDENDIMHGGLLDGKTTMGISARYTIYKNIYVESAVYFYVDPQRTKQPWDPDYSYGFGYFDWRAFRISLTYGNWVINRFPWNKESLYPQYGFIDGNFKIAANYIW
jgi:hypothetical protein